MKAKRIRGTALRTEQIVPGKSEEVTFSWMTEQEVVKDVDNFVSKLMKGVVEREQEEEPKVVVGQFIMSQDLEENIKDFLTNKKMFKALEYYGVDEGISDELIRNAVAKIINLIFEDIESKLKSNLDHNTIEHAQLSRTFFTLLKEIENDSKSWLILNKGWENWVITKQQETLLNFVISLFPRIALEALRNWEKLKLILSIIAEELKKRFEGEALRMQGEEYLDYRMKSKSFGEDDLYIQIEKAQQGSEKDLKFFIEALIKIRCSYEMIIATLKGLDIKYNENVVSTHFIMSTINIVDKHKWQDSDQTYVVLGTMGSGKSSVIQYLRDNLEASELVSYNIWTLQAKTKVKPDISSKWYKAKTVMPESYPITLKTRNALIYDNPGFNIVESYEQEIASWYALQSSLKSLKKPKIIPVFSFYELLERSVSFFNFLDMLSKIMKSKRPSLYVVTKVEITRKNNIIAMLKGFAEDLPKYREILLDMWTKLLIFPCPTNKQFIGDKILSQFTEKIINISPTPLNPDLPISNGAKNRMREILDSWDNALIGQFDIMFDRLFRKLSIESALICDIPTLKSFAEIDDFTKLLGFMHQRVKILLNINSLESLRSADDFALVAYQLKVILEYRETLIKLSGK